MHLEGLPLPVQGRRQMYTSGGPGTIKSTKSTAPPVFQMDATPVASWTPEYFIISSSAVIYPYTSDYTRLSKRYGTYICLFVNRQHVKIHANQILEKEESKVSP